MDTPVRQRTARIIAVDGMSGDLGPPEIVAGVAMAFESVPALEEIVLTGREDVLRPLLAEAGLENHPKLTLHPASEVIEMDEKPVQSLKQKKDSSMVRALELVKEGRCMAAVSCGNTGALMAGGTLKLRRMEGVDRPALASIFPTETAHFLLIDSGANPAARPEHLVHNAILGTHFARIVLARKKPRVGLLSIGTEESKGNELTSNAHAMLKKLGDLIDYRGMIEGYHVFEGDVDIVVCDGFTGNIVLKTCEGLFHMLQGFLKREIRKNVFRTMGAMLAKPAFLQIKQQLNPETYGGAPLLGLRGQVLKAHGSSNRNAIMNAIRIASEIVAHDLNAHAKTDIEKANALIRPPKPAPVAPAGKPVTDCDTATNATESPAANA